MVQVPCLLTVALVMTPSNLDTTALGTASQIATINGGTGTDRLQLGQTAGFVGKGLAAAAFTAIASDAGMLGNVAYASGDSIYFGLTGLYTAANFVANNQINIATGLGDIAGTSVTIAATATAASFHGLLYGNSGSIVYDGANTSYTAVGTSGVVGSIGVYDSGDDLVIGIVGTTAKVAYINVVGGGELIKTTAVGNNVVAASNFGFTISAATSGFSITFS